ncbi:DUF3015 domain-containing protein [Algiphilus sp. NNCM1]|uniref:DUF3015 family protein n=1 Tax=Algiphilus sp. TaxID=1872431 RepID=UPI001CA6425F|nr:DUF3015 family protein [Algiphilus sp.]MBY8964339.1 DUF3015 domain-containing protein [Algiphilus acroporae]MCI5061930.1 DUF3015 domain-containing protein [Algiphilus sp.]MCI5104718.1 DUF3015 domain-containing protein [Algiphilus sp.]
MFKKTIAAAALVAMPVGAALADKDIGCGVGTIIWEGQSGVAPKVLGATTNGTLGNQTFGISTGSLGCSADGAITVDGRTSMFTSTNLDQLAAEIAAGEGETLDTLATLYKIEGADRDAFAAMAQSNYGTIFSSTEVTVADVLAGLESAMQRHQTLARYV